jgi:sugar lactone lactonase YvrE
MKRFPIRVAACAALPVICLAVSTRTWLCSSYADFEKGELKGVSLRSDGRVTLAPKTTELFDSSLAYLWALARDSKGVLYAGGGPGARVYKFAAGPNDAKPEKIAEFDAVEVHALAIDQHDRVYAATFPDGRVYRITPGGKPEEFYNPKCKYIWSMVFDAAGNLYIATGDDGQIFRVTPDGKGEVFFHSDDTHVRTLAFRGSDLIAGTDPTGLVIRISPDKKGFILYQLPKREVTAVAVAPDGSIYAAGAGNQPSSAPAGSLPPAASPFASHAASASGGPGAPNAPAAPAATPTTAAEPPAAPRPSVLTGGSDVYRIDPSGLPEKVWSHSRDVIYSIAFDGNGQAILGSGNKGTIYRIESPSLYTALAFISVNQITALVSAKDGSITAASANVGKVFRLGPGTEREGTVTSEVFDSGVFSSWGRLVSYGDSPQGSIKLEAHSGNLDRPRNYWSDWSTSSPPASRFIQWKATLTGKDAHLDSVEQAYLSRNVAPRVDEIEATPANYKFSTPLVAAILQRVPAAIALPPIGHRSPTPPASSSDSDSSSMTWAKGWIGARWTASDENSDPLSYTLQIRGIDEKSWKPLKEKLAERHYSFDSTAFPDGEYRIRVIASDQPGNTAGSALTGQLDSSPILIDNTPPVITPLAAKAAGSELNVNWKAADALNIIKRAEYSLDGDDWMMVGPVSHLSDSKTLDYALTLSGLAPGEHTIAVRVTDDYENTSVQKTTVGVH